MYEQLVDLDGVCNKNRIFYVSTYSVARKGLPQISYYSIVLYVVVLSLMLSTLFTISLFRPLFVSLTTPPSNAIHTPHHRQNLGTSPFRRDSSLHTYVWTHLFRHRSSSTSFSHMVCLDCSCFRCPSFLGPLKVFVVLLISRIPSS